jgi:tartrate dehydratase alpha subunit/fumarate hydratase class I-like protein
MKLPLCQDCGMAIVFLEVGQRVILRVMIWMRP